MLLSCSEVAGVPKRTEGRDQGWGGKHHVNESVSFISKALKKLFP